MQDSAAVPSLKPDPNFAPKGFLVAAPSSGAGKTTLTLALLRALKKKGVRAVSAKSGPDYIDPKFHEAASGAPCLNLDAWAMTPQTLSALAAQHASGAELLVVEGAMGLFDGAANGVGSAADLAQSLNLPVVLVVDCAKQAQSVAALVHGFATFRSDVHILGVLLNRVGSARHEKMLRDALKEKEISVLGCLPRSEALILPERHLGLVQASEHADLDAFLEQAAALVEKHVDVDALKECASEIAPKYSNAPLLPAPLGQRIAIAQDAAFTFAYPHLLQFWQTQGAELSFFSPLSDEAPQKQADAIFLPGGYPELHAESLSKAHTFRAAMTKAADSGQLIYGECGGYMALGKALIDANGLAHEMLGLLPLETSFENPKRHLGYREITSLGTLPWSDRLSAHEFHYASTVFEGEAKKLFSACDASGNKLSDMGLRVGSVAGSFAHVISKRGDAD